MAQLYTYVAKRSDDEQIAYYDDVLCQLADQVEVEARETVARLLAVLEYAPGNIIVKLANDVIEVAAPLLAFSIVISEADLIEVVVKRTEAHRVAVAGRVRLQESVGDMIVAHGDTPSTTALARNHSATIGFAALQALVLRARNDRVLAEVLRGRSDIDWDLQGDEISVAGTRVLGDLARVNTPHQENTAGKAGEKRSSFSAREWNLALVQVNSLVEHSKLDHNALARFARFSYGHHVAAALAHMFEVGPDTLLAWLAAQDYETVATGLRMIDAPPDLFEAVMMLLPWRDSVADVERSSLVARFGAMSRKDAREIFGVRRNGNFARQGEPARSVRGIAV